jgi:shikimate kinase
VKTEVRLVRRRHVVLVGLPGSGKSTVGPLVAGGLETSFVDLDGAIERRSSVTVPELFGRYGEASFRVLERREMERVLAAEPCVVAAGGGWAAQPGNLESAEGRALLVYLALPAEVAARRVAATSVERPLLAGDVPERMEGLLAARAGCYERCEARVDAAAGPPETVAADVLRLARSRAGWY